MSANFVSTDTITAMLAAALGHTEPNLVGNAAADPLRWYSQGSSKELRFALATQTGQMLLRENLRSMQYRYEDLTDDSDTVAGYLGTIESYVYPPEAWVYSLSAGDVLGALDYYDYQACECDDYSESEAKAFVEALDHRITRKVIPDIGWGLDERDMRKRRTGARVLSAMWH